MCIPRFIASTVGRIERCGVARIELVLLCMTLLCMPSARIPAAMADCEVPLKILVHNRCVPLTARRSCCRFHGIRGCTWPAPPSSTRPFFSPKRPGGARSSTPRPFSCSWPPRCARRTRRGGNGEPCER